MNSTCTSSDTETVEKKVETVQLHSLFVALNNDRTAFIHVLLTFIHTAANANKLSCVCMFSHF